MKYFFRQINNRNTFYNGSKIVCYNECYYINFEKKFGKTKIYNSEDLLDIKNFEEWKDYSKNIKIVNYKEKKLLSIFLQ